MKEAKIEIVARPIKGFEILGKKAPHHLYLLYSKISGEKTVITGGPEGGNSIKNWMVDNIKISVAEYNKSHPDYDQKGTHIYHVLAHGSDDDIDGYMSSLNKILNFINNAQFDYKIAVISFGSWQNSNAVAKIATEAMGLKFALPSYQDNKGRYSKVWAPGFDEKLEYSLTDTFTNPAIIKALHANNYLSHISLDLKTISYVDKETGITVYAENTRAIKIGNAFLVDGYSKEHIVMKYGVSAKNVIENDDHSGILPHKTYTILADTKLDPKPTIDREQILKEGQETLYGILDLFAEPEILDSALNNVQRFMKLAEKQQGVEGKYSRDIFSSLADQTQAVLDFLGEAEEA